MKKLLLVLVITTFAFASQAATSDYFIDDNTVEQVLETGDVLNINQASFDFSNAMMGIERVEAGDSQIVAFLLAWFIGGLGIHRVYLGGAGKLILIYFITCGGIFGVVPLVDGILILINGVDQFTDNDKFIAW